MQEKPPTYLYVTRQVEFSAAHRLYQAHLSEAENSALYGKCAYPFGHGHNYVLEVTLKGQADPATGMMIHFADLRRILEECIVIPLDHRHLNHDVPFLQGILPTSENLLPVFWDRLEPTLKGKSWHLHRLRLASTARNWVDYFGKESPCTPQVTNN